MTAALWLGGLLRRRPGRLAGVAVGIAAAVCLVASLGAFAVSAQATMTTRAAATVAADWQVQTQPGADPARTLAAVRATPGVVEAAPVLFASTPGLAAVTPDGRGDSSTQSTTAAVVLGLPDGYASHFPGEIRPLVGAAAGTLLFQQTAATLRVRPGDTVAVHRTGLADAAVRIDGVVDLPQADSLFQKVGLPPGAQPSAPPDNVILLTAARWRELLGPLAAARPDLASTQDHVRFDRATLPASPADAFVAVSGAARNLETRLSGGARVGDNLGAALDAARADAAYASVLFLVLGIPGVAVAAVLTAVLSGAGRVRRRRELALLRTRGATPATLTRVALAEPGLVAAGGVVLGLGLAELLGRAVFGASPFGSAAARWWSLSAALVGLVVAAATAAVPAVRDARAATVAEARREVGTRPVPAWPWLATALPLLGVALWVYLATRGAGYALVLAPEGVPSISVDWATLAGPAALWLGAAALLAGTALALFGRGRRMLARVARPVTGAFSGTIAAVVSRQGRLLTAALAMVAVAGAFAVSTSIFDATYRQQAEVDARLTNGADVTVSVPAGAPAAGALGARVGAVPGVSHVEPLLHRYAYVGADLQDLFGVRPSTVVDATRLQDAYFSGGTARELVGRLAAQPDGILVSAETVKDFQLRPGDHLVLRLQDRSSDRLVPVTFRFLGVAREFPTAPRDSFLVANAAYVGRATGDAAPSTLLVDTAGGSPPDVAARLRTALGSGVTVQDITATRRVVGSSLTAVDLGGLSRLELGFAIALNAAAGGLVLGLGIVERRRMLAIATALGARPRQLAALMAGEAVLVGILGLAAGALLGWSLSEMLTSALSGVFDPPPSALAVPWAYLAGAAAAVLAALGVAVATGTRLARRDVVTVLRRL